MTPPGWVRVDCHLHTAASGDAVTTIDELAERVGRLGLDVVCVTDHNVISAAVAAAERDIGARVVIGEEIRTPDGDVIGLFLTERVPYVLPLAQVVSLIRGQGGLVYLPHPFDPGRSSLGEAAVRLCEAGGADIIEAFNAKIEDQARNDRAAAAGRPLRAARRGRIGRPRSGRHRGRLPGNARFRRAGGLSGIPARSRHHRRVPPARDPLRASPELRGGSYRARQRVRARRQERRSSLTANIQTAPLRWGNSDNREGQQPCERT